jgi:uncharacterized protein
MTNPNAPDPRSAFARTPSHPAPGRPAPKAFKPGQLEGVPHPLAFLGYVLIGVLLGVVFVQSEVVSWYRIQEMFRFQSFHMYGIIGSAVLVAGIAIQVVKRTGARTVWGEPILLEEKEWGTAEVRGPRYWLGGTIFGLGWGLLGACPGPIFALIGAGFPALVVALLSAMIGAWAYGALRSHLPH